jgi:hypothetical protein
VAGPAGLAGPAGVAGVVHFVVSGRGGMPCFFFLGLPPETLLSYGVLVFLRISSEVSFLFSVFLMVSYELLRILLSGASWNPLGSVLEASWSRLGGSKTPQHDPRGPQNEQRGGHFYLERLGTLLEASWRRLGGVLEGLSPSKTTQEDPKASKEVAKTSQDDAGGPPRSSPQS